MVKLLSLSLSILLIAPLAFEITGPGSLQASAQPALQQSQTRQGVVFEKNVGQWGAEALFRAHAGGYDAFLTSKGMAMVQVQRASKPFGLTGPQLRSFLDSSATVQAWAVRMELVDSNPAPLIRTGPATAYHTNYFIGHDPSHWHPNVPTYTAVTLYDVYPGIDLAYHAASDGSLKYDFIVHTGADPNLIRQRLDGAGQVTMDPDGGLFIQTGMGTIHQGAPVTFQSDGAKVPNRYQITDTTISYDLGPHLPTRDLVIDPLVYSTYFGGTGDDYAYDTAVDSLGEVHVTGTTYSVDYPTLFGSYTTNAGLDDAFVTKLDANGSGPVYSTYLGGSSSGGGYGYDVGYGIALDPLGNAYVTGVTGSGDFPTTSGAYQTVYGTSYDAFVAKLDPAGALVYSTYLGGDYEDFGLDVAVDSAGSAYVTGFAQECYYPSLPCFPATSFAYQTVNAGGDDAFVTKFNVAGSGLVYSTYLGGSGGDEGDSIAVDFLGNAYVSGSTSSTDFPATIGAAQATNAGSDDAFVAKLNAGSGLLYATYLGGSDFDSWNPVKLAVDGLGNAYVAGTTDSMDFPTTLGAYQSTSASLYYHAFVTRVDATGSFFAYSTYLGGNSYDGALDVAVDSHSNAYITGYTYSTDFPTTPAAYQSVSTGWADAFVTKIDATGSILVYSTYLGGTSGEEGDAIAVDSTGNAYVAGTTASTDYPTTNGSPAPGAIDLFVTKLAVPELVDLCPSGSMGIVASNGFSVCVSSSCPLGIFCIRPLGS